MMRSLRRSILSATTPPRNGMKSMGHDREEMTTPISRVESVSCQTSQPLRKTRSVRPMFEEKRPSHRRRKFRSSKAPNICPALLIRLLGSRSTMMLCGPPWVMPPDSSQPSRTCPILPSSPVCRRRGRMSYELFSRRDIAQPRNREGNSSKTRSWWAAVSTQTRADTIAGAFGRPPSPTCVLPAELRRHGGTTVPLQLRPEQGSTGLTNSYAGRWRRP